MTELDNRIKGLQAEFSKIFNPTEAEVKAGFAKVGSPQDLFGNLSKAWREDILPQMQRDWDTFVKWVDAAFEHDRVSFT